jgi:hypothetical protein
MRKREEMRGRLWLLLPGSMLLKIFMRIKWYCQDRDKERCATSLWVRERRKCG